MHNQGWDSEQRFNLCSDIDSPVDVHSSGSNTTSDTGVKKPAIAFPVPSVASIPPPQEARDADDLFIKRRPRLPTRPVGFKIDAYTTASKIPMNVLDALSSHPVDTNCILPTLLKALNTERVSSLPSHDQLWIVCQSISGVELVLSCTENVLGTNPIFIVNLCPLSIASLRPRIQEMVQQLSRITVLRRVYSVFAPDDIAELFAEAWTRETGIQKYCEPYYAAKLSYCTRMTLTGHDGEPNHYLRPAEDSDLDAIAQLCFAFASDSEPFFLSKDDAYTEAEYLIQDKLIWIHSVPGSTRVASIVAFTRNCETNATITKVFTNPSYRGQGYAQRLVRRVTEHLLYSMNKNSVALYVAHDNGAASRFYHNVGFVGLDESDRAGHLATSWKEIGFDRREVDLGHW
ncbi:hypothetical protein L218DRAFT_938225 [Marasmius fiardii PR-910]|nr:hypothetical protein L218DRAFT_938225 [Marasmius fiardii PR-910]